MTEHEWLTLTDPQKMLGFLKGKTSDRNLRLFAVACCRQVLHLMPDDRCGKAAEIAERFADGLATELELQTAADSARDSANDNEIAVPGQPFAIGQGIYFAARTACYAAGTNAHEAAASAARTFHVASAGAAHVASAGAAGEVVSEYRKRLLSEHFGNPFWAVTIAPAWRTTNVLAIATRIYTDRCFQDLPILADALEEAGCNQQDILQHLRSPGEHVRGCWALDLVLGKE